MVWNHYGASKEKVATHETKLILTLALALALALTLTLAVILALTLGSLGIEFQTQISELVTTKLKVPGKGSGQG